MTNQAIMGVSLANQVFTREFAGNLCNWLRAYSVQYLDIVIFDELEAINYRVFRGISSQAALTIAKERGQQLQRMFLAALGDREFPYKCMCESGSDIRSSRIYSDILNHLREVYDKDEQFSRDVEFQILQNLSMRAKNYGHEFIMKRVNELIHYILGEMAYFEAYSKGHPESVEIYPGENLLVKEKMWAGQYHLLKRYSREGISNFINISFLSNRTNDD